MNEIFNSLHIFLQGKLCKCRNKYCKEARRINRVLQRNRHKSCPSLLHEIDAELVIARGFLLGKGLCISIEINDRYDVVLLNISFNMCNNIK